MSHVRIADGELQPMMHGYWGDEFFILELAEGMEEWCLNFWDWPEEEGGLWGSIWYCR